ncbi:multidrug effflux MFS transporter [Caldimonas brevitalea]
MNTSSGSSAKTMSSAEFVALLALLMSIVALSIDALLPALGLLHVDLKLTTQNQAQYIISSLFLGMAFGQLIFGPLSDAFGRKRTLYLGFFFFFAGSALCLFSETLTQMLVGRVIQGFGVAGPYVCAVSIVRDKYSGRQMAKVMSLIMIIFFMVPAIAPSLGQLVVNVSGWRQIFTLYMVYALLLTAWLFLRLEETLAPEKRVPFTPADFARGFKEVLHNRTTLYCTFCIGLFFGGFIGYLNSSQQIFQVQFGTGKMFAVYFGMLALILGSASLINSRVVEKFGMHHICSRATLAIVVASAVFLGVHAVMAIPLWIFLIYASVLFFCFGFMFGNLNAMAMEPMGHLAGIAAAIIGMVSSMMSISIGTFIGQLYDNTLVPLASGFLLLGLLSLYLMGSVPKRTPVAGLA